MSTTNSPTTMTTTTTTATTTQQVTDIVTGSSDNDHNSLIDGLVNNDVVSFAETPQSNSLKHRDNLDKLNNMLRKKIDNNDNNGKDKDLDLEEIRSSSRFSYECHISPLDESTPEALLENTSFDDNIDSNIPNDEFDFKIRKKVNLINKAASLAAVAGQTLGDGSPLRDAAKSMTETFDAANKEYVEGQDKVKRSIWNLESWGFFEYSLAFVGVCIFSYCGYRVFFAPASPVYIDPPKITFPSGASIPADLIQGGGNIVGISETVTTTGGSFSFNPLDFGKKPEVVEHIYRVLVKE